MKKRDPKKLRNRIAGSQKAHRVMRRREEVIGEQIYYGPGITKKRLASIRKAFRAAIRKNLQNDSARE